MPRFRTAASRRLLFPLLATLAAASGAHAQSILDPNEGLCMIKGSDPGTVEMRWFGQTNRTYFIQHSPALEGGVWTYLPYIEQGKADVLAYGLSEPATGERSFFRLRYRSGASTDPKTEDFDGDGLSNMDELQLGTDPLVASADTDHDGLPDDWERAYFGNLDHFGTGDYDGDGVSNGAEYLAGRHPNTSIVYGTSTYKYAGESASGDVVYMTDFELENSLSVTYADSLRTRVSSLSFHPDVPWNMIAHPEDFPGGVVPTSATYTLAPDAVDAHTLVFTASTTTSQDVVYTGRDLLRKIDGTPYLRELGEGGGVHRVAKYLAVTSLPLEAICPTSFPAIIRDFPYRDATDFPDFGTGHNDGSASGFVQATLGSDGLPVSTLTDEDATRKIYSAASFSKWYRKPDAVSVNMELKEGEALDEEVSYGFWMQHFYPFTDVLKDVGGDRNRLAYTTEVHAKLVYDVSETSENPTRLAWRSDDDCWVFVNGHLIIEWAGLSGINDSVLLRDIAHGLTGETGVCDLVIFHAERVENDGALGFMSSGALVPIYAYQVQADTRFGSPVQFSLDPGAPQGMTIDAASGKLLWDYASLPVGIYSATIRVTDANQNKGQQTIRVFLGAKPAFTTQPGPNHSVIQVPLGGNAVLSAEASGTPAPAYQWYYGESPVPGATSATLTLENVDYGDSGLYSVKASNIFGASTSNSVILFVYE